MPEYLDNLLAQGGMKESVMMVVYKFGNGCSTAYVCSRYVFSD